MIRTADAADAEALCRIYNHYVATTIVTFEEAAVAPRDMATRIEATAADGLPWLIAAEHDRIVGYAYGSKWKGRCAYRFSAECTVYVDPARTGQGWGSRLYEQFFPALHASGIHVVMGGIALPNAASVALHEKFGLTKVAHFKEVGFKFGRWIDVGYWQRAL
jgi:L-amino acid N-acyltransferase YncA